MLKICPSCLSLEVEAHCGNCSKPADEKSPIFFLALGWSRSRDFEKILKEFEKEEGYSYRELGEEVIHSIPLYTQEQIVSVLKKYEKTLKWKETNLKIPSGEVFDQTQGSFNCFIKMMTEDQSPCKEKHECPYSPIPVFSIMSNPKEIFHYIYRDDAGNRIQIEEEIPDDALLRLFMSDILNFENVLMCPVYRGLITLMAAKVFPAEVPWAFFASDVGSALKKGMLLLNSDGHYSRLLQKNKVITWDKYETKWVGPGNKWAARIGEKELVSQDDNILMMPDSVKVASWPRARSAAMTTEGRTIILPHFDLNEANDFVILNPENSESIVIGPFPQPWSTDKHLRQVAWVLDKSVNREIFWGQFFWTSEIPTIIVTGSREVDKEPVHLRINSEAIAASFTDNTLWLHNFSGKDHEFQFQDIRSIEWLTDNEIAILWGNGRRISFIKDFKRSDYYLLIKADEMASTISGNVIITGRNRIVEISPNGTVLDNLYDKNAKFVPCRQGYLYRSTGSVSWHTLDDTKVSDVFPEEQPDDVIIVETGDLKNAPEDVVDLLVSLVVYLKQGHQPEEYSEVIKRLWEEAPKKIKPELKKLASTFPFIADAVKGKSSKIPIKSLDELVAIP